MTVPAADHTFRIVEQIPEEDYDDMEFCMLSLESHAALNESPRIVQYTCHGANKYLNLDSVVEWIQSPAATKCMQCRAPLDARIVEDLTLQLKKAKLDKLQKELDELGEPATLEEKITQLEHQLPLVEEKLRLEKENERKARKDLDAFKRSHHQHLPGDYYYPEQDKLEAIYDLSLGSFIKTRQELYAVERTLRSLRKYQGYSKMSLLARAAPAPLLTMATAIAGAPALAPLMGGMITFSQSCNVEDPAGQLAYRLYHRI